MRQRFDLATNQEITLSKIKSTSINSNPFIISALKSIEYIKHDLMISKIRN
jgi:hypothetical protein